MLRHGAVLIGWADTASTGRRASGDALLRALTAQLGIDAPPPTRRCPSCGAGDHGMPEVPGGRVVASLSYADEIVVAAVAPRGDAAALGVDVESAARATGDLTAFFAPRPAPGIREWTRIEAVLKASGRGVRTDPRSIDVSGPVVHIGTEAFDLATVVGPDGYVVSVAAAAPSAGLRSRAPRRR
ncbi:4'-phosphopantetheinyl transferase family protein [Microbacterium koreense]